MDSSIKIIRGQIVLMDNTSLMTETIDMKVGDVVMIINKRPMPDGTYEMRRPGGTITIKNNKIEEIKIFKKK